MGHIDPPRNRLAVRAIVLRVLSLHRLVGSVVVLVVVDLPARIVLLAVHLSALLLRQLSAVGGAVTAHLIVDVRFLILQVSCLVRR